MLTDVADHSDGVQRAKGLDIIIEHVVVTAVMSCFYQQLPLWSAFCRGQSMDDMQLVNAAGQG